MPPKSFVTLHFGLSTHFPNEPVNQYSSNTGSLLVNFTLPPYFAISRKAAPCSAIAMMGCSRNIVRPCALEAFL